MAYIVMAHVEEGEGEGEGERNRTEDPAPALALALVRDASAVTTLGPNKSQAQAHQPSFHWASQREEQFPNSIVMAYIVMVCIGMTYV